MIQVSFENLCELFKEFFSAAYEVRSNFFEVSSDAVLLKGFSESSVDILANDPERQALDCVTKCLEDTDRICSLDLKSIIALCTSILYYLMVCCNVAR